MSSLPALALETVTLVTSTVTGQDAYGKDILTPVEILSPGWVIWPAGQGAELVQGQDILTDNLTALAPVGTVISAIDKVKRGGKTYEVQGTPWPWANPFTGTIPGTQVQLKVVTG